MKDLSDEKLDQLLRKIVRNSGLSENRVEEIADDPKLLWNVRRSIEQQKATSKKSWRAAFGWRIPAFASLLFLIGTGIFWSFSFYETQNVAETKSADGSEAEKVFIEANSSKTQAQPVVSENKATDEISKPEKKAEERTLARSVNEIPDSKKIRKAERISKEAAGNIIAKEQIKTDFIALSYSSAAESGQILNVKVPRSMMVALGVTSNVENISELVAAEIVVGDDGLARAIRFVREN